ncbi:LacI family transcriptional regulator [Xylanibacillus composti]|uniref:Methylthioribose-binding protein n=1 Tax=Xylanibacillus composti TaxID=1572762 RepID=A0A8J4H0Y4_9BACL|nr:sugar ABC transporter substrate-binding protein [Xylanibacillus composti]MDT9727110.1 LacI family transcriptional regulator [Xylanibacillus composti]GIQ68879.1 methylthioribose-binding protein [Xylanibacillus composti]
MAQTKRIIMLLLVAVLTAALLAACGSNGGNGNASNVGNEANSEGESNAGTQDAGAENHLAGKKIALIMQFNTGTFSAQYINGVKEQAEKLGGEVTVFASDNDIAKMASNLDQAVNQKFDGILIDHGNKDALQAGVQKALDNGIAVVAFDAAMEMEGVTDLQQDDQKMAELTLDRLAQDIGEEGNIVKVWVAGFAPMERRQIAYEEFQAKYPNITEIASFGNASNPLLDSQSQMEALLKKYPEGEIDAVWAAWDEFAKGASLAIQQAGRTEIKVYGIDMSDEDLQMIQDPSNPWIASAAVDPTDIGRVQVRYLYQKFNGDETPEKVILEPVFVSADNLPEEQISTEELSEYVEGWGSSEQGYTDWMKEIEQ